MKTLTKLFYLVLGVCALSQVSYAAHYLELSPEDYKILGDTTRQCETTTLTPKQKSEIRCAEARTVYYLDIFNMAKAQSALKEACKAKIQDTCIAEKAISIFNNTLKKGKGRNQFLLAMADAVFHCVNERGAGYCNSLITVFNKKLEEMNNIESKKVN